MGDALCVGVIPSTHGVRGEVKVFPIMGDVTRFKELKEVVLDTGKEQEILTIRHVEFFKNMAIPKFKDYDSINDIGIYKGRDLLIPRKQAVKLAPSENFIVDLIGLKVVTENGDTFGVMINVSQTGANDACVVGTPEGKEVLPLAIPSCTLGVNLETSTITVRILDGLLNL